MAWMGGPAVPGFWLPHHLQSFQHVQNRSKSKFLLPGQWSRFHVQQWLQGTRQGRIWSKVPSLPRAKLVVPSMEKKQSLSKYRVFRRWASLTHQDIQNQRMTSQSAGKGAYFIPSDGDDKPLSKDLGDHNSVKSFALLADQCPLPC